MPRFNIIVYCSLQNKYAAALGRCHKLPFFNTPYCNGASSSAVTCISLILIQIAKKRSINNLKQNKKDGDRNHMPYNHMKNCVCYNQDHNREAYMIWLSLCCIHFFLLCREYTPSATAIAVVAVDSTGKASLSGYKMCLLPWRPYVLRLLLMKSKISLLALAGADPGERGVTWITGHPPPHLLFAK